ncbi:MAG: hypothetical protein J0L81_15195 [Caulobacterales bacterium]|jgi:hypothetical protein|nr:hypothetical protein [Caulobacterales bacterium]
MGDKPIAVITVHGTNDTAEGPEGEKWFQRGSHFATALSQRLIGRGIETEIVPFLWTGANSASAREAGAEKLAAKIRSIGGRYSGVHIVGHSHGGNVANDAALLLRWGRRKRAKEQIASLTTIGTPFLSSRSSAAQSFGGWLFLAITWLSIPLYMLTTLMLFLWVSGNDQFFELNDVFGAPNASSWFSVWLCVLGVGIPLWLMFQLATRGLRRVMRPRASANERARVFSVWHGNDEAISFLKQVEGLPLEPFPSGSMMRGSRSGAISFGVLAVILACVAPALLAFAAEMNLINLLDYNSEWLTTAIVLSLFTAPIVFALAYLLYRGVAGLVGEHLARKRLNAWVTGVLRGIAFGRDGDQAIGEVRTAPHLHAVREHCIEGEVAARMQANAAAAAGKLIEQYRWALFTVGADSNSPLANLANDAMTWSSLIHTTYFDQPEVVDLIADYIADEVDDASAGRAVA